MHEDIDDFEPDWSTYYQMDQEERETRNAKYKLYLRYSNNKISYDEYLEKLDHQYYYAVLDDDEWKEINNYRIKKAEKAAEIAKNFFYKKIERQKKKRKVKQIWTYIFFIIMVIAIAIGLLKK